MNSPNMERAGVGAPAREKNSPSAQSSTPPALLLWPGRRGSRCGCGSSDSVRESQYERTQYRRCRACRALFKTHAIDVRALQRRVSELEAQVRQLMAERGRVA